MPLLRVQLLGREKQKSKKSAISLTSSLSPPELTELSELENGLVAFFLVL